MYRLYDTEVSWFNILRTQKVFRLVENVDVNLVREMTDQSFVSPMRYCPLVMPVEFKERNYSMWI